MINFIYPTKLIFLNSVKSTNTYAKKYYKKFSIQKKFWIIISSKKQINGYGRSGSWISDNNKNLTFSIIINIKNIYINDIYFINIIVCNSIHKIISKIIKSTKNKKINCYIKWPNDIILNNKKISGILTESISSYNKIHAVIVGIGINILQKNFYFKLNATSLINIFNKKFNLRLLLYRIIFFIQSEYYLFENYNNKLIKKYYIKNLFLSEKKSVFFLIKKNIYIYGTIKNVTDSGYIIIEFNKKLFSFYQKEIKFIL